MRTNGTPPKVLWDSIYIQNIPEEICKLTVETLVQSSDSSRVHSWHLVGRRHHGGGGTGLVLLLLLHHGSPELVPVDVVEQHFLSHRVLYALPDACKEVIN